MWLIALILFAGVVLLVVSTLQGDLHSTRLSAGSCPTCRHPLERLEPGPTVQPRRSWEVLACATCPVTAPAVQGIPGAPGWCPRCRQHAMELRAARLPAEPHAPIRVEVRERCHLCGHAEQIVVEQRSGSGRGQVIPFPGRRD